MNGRPDLLISFVFLGNPDIEGADIHFTWFSLEESLQKVGQTQKNTLVDTKRWGGHIIRFADNEFPALAVRQVR